MTFVLSDLINFERWKFAARYNLLEAEEYARESETVLDQIEQFIVDPTKGLLYFVDYGIPLSIMDVIVRQIMLELIGPHGLSEMFLKLGVDLKMDQDGEAYRYGGFMFFFCTILIFFYNFYL